MKDQKFFNLCARKLSGALTPEEEKTFSEYLDKNPDQKDVFQSIKRQWDLSGHLRLNYQSDPQRSWSKFSELKSGHQPKTVRWIHFATRLAAMVLLTVGLGFLMREFGKTEPYLYATFEGETKWVTLPDSSRIKLNESTMLTVAADFNESDRNVSLKGEAFFEIVRNESKPFMIETESSKTRVLGTSFNIRAKEEELVEEIFVVSGRVSFSAHNSELILTKGMAANLNKKNNLLALQTNKDNAMSWISNALKFQDATLDQVFADLQDYFKVKIIITNDNIKNCRFTGEFKKPQLEEILKVISISTAITYSEDNNSYTIRGEGCSTHN